MVTLMLVAILTVPTPHAADVARHRDIAARRGDQDRLLVRILLMAVLATVIVAADVAHPVLFLAR
jgi:hypothetical protein